MSTQTLSIDGMHCEHCVESVRDALDALDGVSVEHVEIGQANISGDSVTVDELSAVLDEAGYELVS
jgi:copper chaperone